VTFPRVPGIEAVGVVEECPGGEFAPGQQVAALMGGMGRTFDGGYAEYTCVPALPGDRRVELRCYMRDPDSHLTEVGQATALEWRTG
jgi:NADPH:quinone reductase-like Zn-dependent oxidoreductase